MTPHNTAAQPGSRRYYPWVLVIFCAFFLIYKYVLQVYPAVIPNELMREFHLDGVGLGNLAATFFYSYMVVQLFAGPLIDKLGGRFLCATAILTCAIGAIGFSTAHALWLVLVFRALMGTGAAFATIGYLKITSAWFSAKRYAFVSGLLASAAMIGSMIGQYPFAVSVEHVGWQHTLFFVGIFGVIFALLFYLVVRSDPQHISLEASPVEKHAVSLKSIWRAVNKRHNWFLMIYAGLSFSPLAVFSGLWGDAFLETVYHVSKPDAAMFASLSFLDWRLAVLYLALYLIDYPIDLA